MARRILVRGDDRTVELVERAADNEVELQDVLRQAPNLIPTTVRKDRVTLHASVAPPAILEFGHGPAPDVAPRSFNVDEGWTRAAGATINEAAPPGGTPMPSDRHDLAELLRLPRTTRRTSRHAAACSTPRASP
jgi:hypothetical protein